MKNFAHRKLTLICVILCSVILFFGCAVNNHIIDQKEIYFRDNPELAKKYTRFSITSFESREDYLMEEFVTVERILSAVEKRHSEDTKLADTVDDLFEIYQREYDKSVKSFYGMSKDDLKSGDSLYLYKTEDQGKIETGLIVLNNGKLRKKYIYMNVTVFPVK